MEHAAAKEYATAVEHATADEHATAVDETAAVDRLGALATLRRVMGRLRIRRDLKKVVRKRLEKVAVQVEGRAKVLRSEARALASVWNEQQLRSGHEMELSIDRPRHRRVWTHGNLWSMKGILREAFCALHRTCTTHVRHSHREIDAMAVVSMAHGLAVNKFVSSELAGIHAGVARRLWLRVHRAFDETPIVMSFGKLYDLLAPVARYWTTMEGADKSIEVRCLTFEEYKQHKLGRQKARAGVLEVMAQTCHLSIATSVPSCAGAFVQIERPWLRLPPRIVESNDASTLFAAMETSVPGLQLSKLGELLMGGGMSAICIDLGGDLAAANQRVWFKTAHELRKVNERVLRSLPRGATPDGLFLLLAHGCFGHVLHTVTEKEFRTKELIPNLHAMASSCRNLHTYSTLYRAMQKVKIYIRYKMFIFYVVPLGNYSWS